MNPKNTFWLVALTAGMFAFIFFYERHQTPPPPPIPRVLPDFKPGEVTSVQVHPSGRLEIRAEHDTTGWHLTRPLATLAQPEYVEALLQTLGNLNYQLHLTAETLKDHPRVDEEFGFDQPQFTILVDSRQGTRQLKVGRFTTPGDQVYVQVVGTEGVYVTGIDFIRMIPRQGNDWRDTAFVHLKDLEFDHITVTNGAKVFELQRDATDKPWRMTYPIPARADNAKITELLFRLRNTRVTKFETDDPHADLDAFGLEPAQYSLAFSSGTNAVLLLQFGRTSSNFVNQIYARVVGQSGVVLIPEDQVAAWQEHDEKFRDPRLAGWITGPIDTVEVGGTNNFSVTRQADGNWRVLSGDGKVSWPGDTNRVRDFLDMLTTLEVASSPGQFAVSDAVINANLPEYGLAEPTRRYVLKRAGEPGGTNQVLAELDFGGLKDGKIYARRGDRPEETSVYFVRLEDYQHLPASGLALRERRIWNFSEDNVLRLGVTQNGQTRQLLRREANSWALAPGSQGILDQSQEFMTEAAVGELGTLEADNWVACGDDQQAAFGFGEHPQRITLNLKGSPPAEISLDLGGWSPSHRRYGAVRLEGQTWIFEIPAGVYDHLSSYLQLREPAAP